MSFYKTKITFELDNIVSECFIEEVEVTLRN